MSTTPTVATVPLMPSASEVPRRSRFQFPLAGLLVLVGVLAALLWSGSAETAVTASLEAATHGQAEGLTVTVHPDPYFVYSEDGAGVIGITVTAPDGTALPVTLTSESFTYGPHREGLQVGTFEVPPGAGLVDYRVMVTTTQGQGDAAIAVTTFDVASFNRMNRWGVAALLAVNVGVAVALLVLPAGGARFRRSG